MASSECRCASAEEVLGDWNDEQQSVVRGLMEKYGQPDEFTENLLIWRERDQWHEILASKNGDRHEFPFPHTDFVESSTRYRLPAGKACDLAEFDGSVSFRRTEGLISARCHDEEANFLALNLADDIVHGRRSVDEARQAYVDAMIDYRSGQQVPYMQRLHFPKEMDTTDPDTELITSQEMAQEAERRK
jgi:hypothetical protein